MGRRLLAGQVDREGAAMRIIDIRDVRTHFLRLIDKAALGEAFVIARADKPVVKVVAFESPARIS